jgi:hypothetical protein
VQREGCPFELGQRARSRHRPALGAQAGLEFGRAGHELLDPVAASALKGSVSQAGEIALK